MKHKHHIIPRHMGGTDDPSNLIELTPEEHAEEHRKLYEKYGKLEDLKAWRGLLGLETSDEIYASFGHLGPLSRSHTNKGKKYKAYSKTKGSTKGLKWYHNPNDPTQKICVKDESSVPEGWIRGQGRKAKNPGLNFTSKLRS